MTGIDGAFTEDGHEYAITKDGPMIVVYEDNVEMGRMTVPSALPPIPAPRRFVPDAGDDS